MANGIPRNNNIHLSGPPYTKAGKCKVFTIRRKTYTNFFNVFFFFSFFYSLAFLFCFCNKFLLDADV